MNRAQILTMGSVLAACGPTPPDLDDVYPRNCGLEGPVELFVDEAGRFPDARRAGEHYLVRSRGLLWRTKPWAVDRCGESRARLDVSGWDPTEEVGVAGEHILACNEDSGAMARLDPTGAPPRPIFGPVESCRVVPFGSGLAAQEQGGGTVWFHPDPSDPEQEAVVVTDSARIADPDWIWCEVPELDCDSWHPFGVDIRAAGDDLLVALDDGRLLAFSTTSLSSRILDPGPLFAMDVLAGGDHVLVDRELGPNYVIERETGAAVEFGFYSDYEPLQQHGEWLVQGNPGSPVYPIPDEWTTFRAYHVPSGRTTTVLGNEQWGPLALLAPGILLADIGPSYDERQPHAVWLETGERRPVAFDASSIWAVPGVDGVFGVSVHGDNDELLDVHFLPGPSEAVRTVLEGVLVVFPTADGRIVFLHPDDPDSGWGLAPFSGSLSVMLPDETVVEIDHGELSIELVASFQGPWPLDRDEVVYARREDDRWVAKRTVLP